MEQNRKWVVDTFRVRFVDGQPIALMIENGTDTIYELKRASKQFKDQLFEEAEVPPAFQTIEVARPD